MPSTEGTLTQSYTVKPLVMEVDLETLTAEKVQDINLKGGIETEVNLQKVQTSNPNLTVSKGLFLDFYIHLLILFYKILY